VSLDAKKTLRIKFKVRAITKIYRPVWNHYRWGSSSVIHTAL